MMTPYRESDSDAFYRHHFREQTGGFPVFIGKEVMGGRGFGSVLSGLMRSAAPLLKRGAVALGKRALATGATVARDILRGENVGQSIKRGAKRQAADLVDDVLFAMKPDAAKRARVTKPKRPRRTKRPRKTVL
jgi:hypothetical protein